LAEDLLEAFQGAQVAAAGTRRRDLQRRGGLVVVELLEVPQGEHLAVHRVHAVEGLLQAQLHLGADGRLQGGRDLAQQAGGQARGVSRGGPPEQVGRFRDAVGAAVVHKVLTAERAAGRAGNPAPRLFSGSRASGGRSNVIFILAPRRRRTGEGADRRRSAYSG